MMQPGRSLHCQDECANTQTAKTDRQMERGVFLPHPHADQAVHTALVAGCVSPLSQM